MNDVKQVEETEEIDIQNETDEQSTQQLGKLTQVLTQDADGQYRKEFRITNRAQRRNMEKANNLPCDLNKKKKSRKSKSR